MSKKIVVKEWEIRENLSEEDSNDNMNRKRI